MLLTKLFIPNTGNNTVHRQYLFDKLNEGLNRRLILISAPAGFGKTTLLSNWINENKIPTAWFSIDKSDNEIGEFLTYIIYSIQNIKADFGVNTLALLKSANKPNVQSIVSLLINDLQNVNQDFLLVLDDFHLIENIEISELTTLLIKHIPDTVHLVISARSDPNLSLAKLRSQQQMIELRSSDLSFKANEISLLFNKKLKLGLSVEDIISLETKTEGWIAGLQLAAISMQGNDNKSVFINAFAGNNRYIMDYLIEEVLRLQTEDMKEFLLKSSVLEQFSADLCNTILNKKDSQLILEKLEKDNLFIVALDSEKNWYRYHHLFADLLKHRLHIIYKSSVENIHNLACEWFEKQKMYELALNHSLEINNYEKSIQLLDEVAERFWQNGLHTAIIKYGEIIPDVLIKNNPEFCLYYSWILVTSGQIKKASPFLASAEQFTRQKIDYLDQRNEDSDYYRKLLGKIAVAIAYSYSHEEHSIKIFDYCKLAMENLSESDPLWFGWAWFSSGIAYFSEGDLIKSIDAFNTAFEYGKKSGNIYLISTIAIRLAENEQQLGHYISAYNKCYELLKILNDKGYSQISKAEWTYAALYFIMGISQYMWADYDLAYENIKTAYDLCKGGNDLYLKITILMVYSVVLIEIGDSESDKRIAELEELLGQNNIPPFLLAYYIGWKSFLYLEKNQVDKASQIFSEYGLDLNKEKNHANETAYSSYVRVLLAQNKTDEAESLLSELLSLAINGNRIERIIDLKVSSAILYKIKGEKEKAIADLTEALQYASKENLMIGFIFSRNQINDLLNYIYKVKTNSKTGIPIAFLDKLKLAIDKKENQKKFSAELDLSLREVETLKLIASNLTNQQIADQLFISLNTVKTHLKNIFLKLNVDSRIKAVTKGKEAGII